MSRKKSIRSRKYYSIIASVIFGAAVSALVFILCTFVISTADIPYKATVFMGTLVVVSGGFAAGYEHGKRKRRKGIKCGFICACIFTAVFIIFSLAVAGRVSIYGTFKKFILLVIFSVTGGIIGVNTKMKRPPV